MTPKIKALLIESEQLAKKLRGKLTELEAINASLESVNRNEAADLKELDSLLAVGDFENDLHVKTVAEKNARLQLYPAKRRQLEGDAVGKKQAFETYIVAVHNLLLRISGECRQTIEQRIASALRGYISEEHRVLALAQNASEFADLAREANYSPYGGYSQSQIQSCNGDFMGLAQSGITELERLPAIIEKHTPGKVMAQA